MDRLPLPSSVRAPAATPPCREPKAVMMPRSPMVTEEARTYDTFTAQSKRGCRLHCVLTEPLQPRPGTVRTDVVDGVIVLVHAAPLGSCNEAPLPGLCKALTVGTCRFDLTGCGASEGEPGLETDRDVEDICSVLEHLRSRRKLSVVGLVGVGAGGTAVLRHAVLHPADVPHVVSVSARVSLGSDVASRLTWAELKRLEEDGKVEVGLQPRGGGERARTLVLRASDRDAKPELAELAHGVEAHFLVLHGSLDKSVPPSEAEALDGLLGGSLSHELRVVPGVGSEWDGHEGKLAYAIGDWLWRRTQQADPSSSPLTRVPGDREPSGFNIFVDDLGRKVREIHAEARFNLPSINALGGAGESDDDEDDDAPVSPIVTAHSSSGRGCGP